MARMIRFATALAAASLLALAAAHADGLPECSQSPMVLDQQKAAYIAGEKATAAVKQAEQGSAACRTLANDAKPVLDEAGSLFGRASRQLGMPPAMPMLGLACGKYRSVVEKLHTGGCAR